MELGGFWVIHVRALIDNYMRQHQQLQISNHLKTSEPNFSLIYLNNIYVLFI
jgi:hypothetical protein